MLQLNIAGIRTASVMGGGVSCDATHVVQAPIVLLKVPSLACCMDYLQLLAQGVPHGSTSS